jgi:CubicO group peptidase (beta-lactamase class C family)
MAHLDALRALLTGAVRDGVTPAVAVEAGDATRPLLREEHGRLTYDAGAAPVQHDTVFDLASLTKVIATTALVMTQYERGVVALDDPLSRYLPSWPGGAAAPVTVRDLLAHCSGLPAYAPLYQSLTGRAAFEAAICATPLAYAPRHASVYSDLGFMLLGFLLDDVGGLAESFTTLWTRLGAGEDLQFLPPAIWQRRTAPTEHDPWRKRLLLGEVHDENAAALGGVAGHAGLFGTASAVGVFARHLLQVLDGRAGLYREDTVRLFTTRRDGIPGSSRALGWDTMLPTSSCGTRMSPRAFGHTGFTGTSLWIDPDRGAYVVLLTNRVHPSRHNEGITALRPAVHDAVMTAFDGGALRQD